MKHYAGKADITEHVPEVLFDESRFSLGTPQKVYFPVTREDVRTVVLEAIKSTTGICITGGKTGIAGGSVPTENCIMVCFADMNNIQSVNKRKDGTLILQCDPGVTLETINTFLENPAIFSYPVPGSEALKPKAWIYPPDPTELTAQLGGTVATNASGARSYYFGATRKYVESLSLVLANGDTISIERGKHTATGICFTITTDQGNTITIPVPTYTMPAVKNASGYYSSTNMDFVDLIIGSEGTLAIITQIGIRCVKNPGFAGGLSFFPDRKSAFNAATLLRKEQTITAIEYFDGSALKILDRDRSSMSLDIPQFPADFVCAVYWETTNDNLDETTEKLERILLTHGSSLDVTWSGFDASEMAELKAFRHYVPEAINSAIAEYKRSCPVIRKISTDAALPAEKFADTIEHWIINIQEAQLEYAVFGHLGDYHLHINIIPHNEDQLSKAILLYKEMMHDTVLAHGSVSAEHGIGKLKTDYLKHMYGEQGIEEMKKVKKALDPNWILSRGNLFEI